MKRGWIISSILINYWPAVHVLLIVLAAVFISGSWEIRLASALAVLYLLPPILCRLILLIGGKIPRSSRFGEAAYFRWWMTSQLQIIFLRFPFLEEIIRLVPGAFSWWLRLWGSQIGKFVYWSPQVQIMDRSFLKIGDFVMVGYGAAFTSHHVNRGKNDKAEDFELVFGIPTVGDWVILGGMCGLSPGVEVGAHEMLPSTMLLTPFYVWKDGRRHKP